MTSRPAPPETQGVDRALALRGKYIAIAADCNSCHTAPAGKPFAGGNALKSAFGIIYGANITPDAQTGIGGWTETDFERALRRGVRKDGAYLYPAMPYGSYTKMTDADVHALWTYIKGLPAVRNVVPKNTLPFPLTIRAGIAVWQSLYFTPGVFTPDSGKDASWNRGAYLVQALGHCSECHTPRNAAQGLEPQHALTGAQIEGWYAPDIAGDSASKLRGWTAEQLAAFLKSGVMPNNTKAVGPMQEVVHDSLQYLNEGDIHAMVSYLRAPQGDATPRPAPAVKFARLTAGKRVYEDNCSSCHQADGKGRTSSVPALAGNDAVTAQAPYNVIMAILEGFKPQGTWGAMGSFAALSDDEIADVTNYVRTAWNNGAAPNATPWSVSAWRKNAQVPGDETHALLCPDLKIGVLKPALALRASELKRAAVNGSAMTRVVGEYRAAAPKASGAEVVEALSTAYCRAIAKDPISTAHMSAQLADFSQRVAVAL